MHAHVPLQGAMRYGIVAQAGWGSPCWPAQAPVWAARIAPLGPPAMMAGGFGRSSGQRNMGAWATCRAPAAHGRISGASEVGAG